VAEKCRTTALIGADAPSSPRPASGKEERAGVRVEVAKKVGPARTTPEAVAEVARRNYARLFRRAV